MEMLDDKSFCGVYRHEVNSPVVAPRIVGADSRYVVDLVFHLDRSRTKREKEVSAVG